MFFLSC
jgi:hypothetical protein